MKRLYGSNLARWALPERNRSWSRRPRLEVAALFQGGRSFPPLDWGPLSWPAIVLTVAILIASQLISQAPSGPPGPTPNDVSPTLSPAPVLPPASESQPTSAPVPPQAPAAAPEPALAPTSTSPSVPAPTPTTVPLPAPSAVKPAPPAAVEQSPDAEQTPPPSAPTGGAQQRGPAKKKF